MNVDIIQAIHEAEEKADAIVAKAHMDAKKIVTDAKQEAAHQHDIMLEQAREKAENIKEGAKDDVKDTLTSIETQFEKEKQSIEQQADSHFKSAVDTLINKVVG